MATTSSTAIKTILIIAAVLLVAWWAWPRLSRELGATNSATALSPKDAAPTATLIAKTPQSAVAFRASTPPTFTEALTKLSPADKEYVKAANNRLYGALDYRSIRELQWKLERGFPSMEETLALRGQPVPPVLTNEQFALLTPQQTIKYFLQWTLAEQGKPGSHKELNILWMTQMRAITNALDTPFPAYLRASMADERSDGGQANLMHQAMTAALYGDRQLAWEVHERLNSVDSDSKYLLTLVQLSSAASLVATDQIEGCVDRYTGNPRTVEELRQQREQRRIRGNCK